MKKMIFGLMAAFVMSLALTSCKDSKSASNEKDNEETTEQAAKEEGTKATKADADVTFEAKGDTPVEKMVSMMEQMYGILKDTHIKSEGDVAALKGTMEKFKTQIETVQKEMEELGNNLDEKEGMKMLEQILPMLQKLETMGTDFQKEADRLKQEAEENGIDIKDVDLNFD